MSTERPCGVCNYSNSWNVLFFGTDDFSIETLKKLHSGKSQLVNSLEVVTSDKRLKAVKKYALDHNLPLHNWPIDVPKGKYDVGVVASFGHLIPETTISAFPWGMINVHASLLPRWRGAAPVIHAVLNGDSNLNGELRYKLMNASNILMQESCDVPQDITAQDLTKQLANLGARLLMKCLENLPENLQKSIPQNSLQMETTKAPKVTLKMAVVNWNQESLHIYRQYRALTGYFELETSFRNNLIKLDKMMSPSFIQTLQIEDLFKKTANSQIVLPGSVYIHRKRNILCIRCQDYWAGFQCVLVKNYKWMNPLEFYNGFLSKIPFTEWRFQ
uniref:methionyl-tRNA formyltransferase n=1 Tax=Strigamia maritima TaxID=126957 RepID=T1IXA0_STRMM